MALVNKSYLDYTGLSSYDTKIKEYIDGADDGLDTRVSALEEEVGGIDITASGNILYIGYVYKKTGALVDFSFSGSSLVIE